jgi:serine/threonine protein kinase
MPDTLGLFAPMMIVELAWSQAPTLEDYFRIRHDQEQPQDFGDEGTDCYSLIADIADGLSVLHHCEVLHSDLKPSNILLFPDSEKKGLVAKIGDFGFADVDRVLTHSLDTAAGPVVGVGRGQTREWAAPEMLQSCPIYIRRLASTVSIAGDVYSFGLLMAYIVLGGRGPRTFVQRNGSTVSEQDEELDRLKIDNVLSERIEEAVRLRWENSPGQIDEKAGIVLDLIRDIVMADPTARPSSLSDVRRKIMG